jgi:hypothetical protein
MSSAHTTKPRVKFPEPARAEVVEIVRITPPPPPEGSASVKPDHSIGREPRTDYDRKRLSSFPAGPSV